MSSYKTKKTLGNTEWFEHDRFGMFIHWGLYAMPARNMLDDAISYSAQITKKRRRKNGTEDGEYLSDFRKSDTLVPVVTVVIHFGTD
jgi:hypothetical protein